MGPVILIMISPSKVDYGIINQAYMSKGFLLLKLLKTDLIYSIKSWRMKISSGEIFITMMNQDLVLERRVSYELFLISV
jgi:hypothetical protein